MDFELTEHARESLRKRPNIRLAWVEQVLPIRSEANRMVSILTWNTISAALTNTKGGCCESS
jgi:hypothetical protein